MNKKEKYLTATEQYEVWKAKFKAEMYIELESIFEDKLPIAMISVRDVDKWNVWFTIFDSIEHLEPIKAKLEALSCNCEKATFGICCKIAAKTEDELHAKMMCLKLSI